MRGFELGKIHRESDHIEQNLLGDKSMEAPTGLDASSEFLRQSEMNMFLFAEKMRTEFAGLIDSETIEKMGHVKDDPETLAWLGASKADIEALEQEGLNVLDQVRQKVSTIESSETGIAANDGLDAVRELPPKYDVPLEKESIAVNDSMRSSGREEKVAREKPKLVLKKDPVGYEVTHDPRWQYNQRLNSLEVQKNMTEGRAPRLISAINLSEYNTYNRSAAKVFEKYQNAYDTVGKYRESNTPPRELFKQLFGVEPRGGVTVDYGSIDIALLLDDESDYARAIYEKDDVDPTLQTKVKYHGGSTLSGGSIPRELSGKVILIPKGSDGLVTKEFGNVLAHERQHVQNSLYEDTRYHDLPKTVTPEAIIAASEGSKRDTILAYLRYERRFVDNGKIHDELLAHYKGFDTASKDDIGKKIVANLVISYRGGFYAYKTKKCRETLEKIGIEPPMIEECLTESFQNESWREIRDAAYCLKDLEDSGLSKDEATNLVQMEPLARWPEVAMKFIEMRKT